MAKDPAFFAHQEWLGYVQPTGLVVSIPALIDASAFLNRNYGPDHQRFLSALPQDTDGEPIPKIADFLRFATDVLGWNLTLIAGATGAEPLPSELEVTLENYNETLRPIYALRNLSGDAKWLLLVDVLPSGTELDEIYSPHDRGWQASPQARFERLLRQTSVAIGLLVNGSEIRLVYAPEKELSGHITFKLAEMVQVAGRPIFAALQMLLGSERLYSVADKERLPAILSNSRKYQNVVSTQLAEQVLEALYEILRGFQAANDQTKGELLREVLAHDPDHVYHGLLTTLLRLVFVLYAEDRGLLSTDPIYSNNYSVTGLHERLRADAGRFNDTMDQRYGAWAQLLALFRLVYSGGSHGAMKIPPREGYLFDQDRYLFLEGRHSKKDKPTIPRVSDGVVYRVLSKLLLLDGERLSYRTLAVEQIGSVYQAIMGFSLQVATGRSIAIKAVKKHGAPATINLEDLLGTAEDKRLKKFTEETDQKLTGPAADALKAATSMEGILAALERKIATAVTPVPVPRGAMIFQASDERRKSGSHYTPSTLTGPIVEAALAPILKQLGPNPTPAQILNLKVCDPSMGSAAFLVEASRQLGDALMKAWHTHNEVPSIPLDEDEALFAQRMIAQRCLYGLDKNPMAADLAKLSLWLATLAKDHPFTFFDHSLRHGEALVGLTRKQIASFNWEPGAQTSFFEEKIGKLIERVTEKRQQILNARDDTPYAQLAQELGTADDLLSLPKMIGDAAIAAFFSAHKPKPREEARKRMLGLVEADLKAQGFISLDGEVDEAIKALRNGTKGIAPFHWELEFPEVFSADKKGNIIGGFDAIVGNPPFAGKNTLIHAHHEAYQDWLKELHPTAHGNADLVAHFFRRAFSLVRRDGCFGLIATNTIAQGDTRFTGLRWICQNGGTIYRALKRLKWPGEAAVIVSVVHIAKGETPGPYYLDGREVPVITAYLFHAGSSENPFRLHANENKSFVGSIVLGPGFIFDDEDENANSVSLMHELIARDPRNAQRIFPYLGGSEMLGDPQHRHRRFVISFGDMTEEETRQWPDLMAIVERKVKPYRLAQNREIRARYWWRFGETAPALNRAIRGLSRVLMHPFTSTHLAFAFIPAGTIVAGPHYSFALETYSWFAALQTRVHELWARFQASSMKDDLRYSPSDSFETFPFPIDCEINDVLNQSGREYYELRAGLLVARSEGLTATYNRFHNPDDDCPDMKQLRASHDAMDRAALDAYAWTDIQPKCEFFSEFDDEDEEDENGRTRRKKYRYRWADDVRDEVLARLLELNRQRALEEGQGTAGDAAAHSGGAAEKKFKKVKQGSTAGLFGMNEEEA